MNGMGLGLGINPEGRVYRVRNLLSASDADTGWTAIGTSPPTIALSQNYLSNPCAAVTFPATTPAGYASSRADRNGFSQVAVESGKTYVMSCGVSFNRVLAGSESIEIFHTGVIGMNAILFNSSNTSALVGTWGRVASAPEVSSATGNNAPALFLSGNVGATPLIIYIRQIQIELNTETPYQSRP